MVVPNLARIWRAFGLQPHRLESFKLSTDPDFMTKVRDVDGLYVSRQERAIVWCADVVSLTAHHVADPKPFRGPFAMGLLTHPACDLSKAFFAWIGSLGGNAR
jgi:hypothetical protein